MSGARLILASSLAHMHTHMTINLVIAILPALQAMLILSYTKTELIAAVFFIAYSLSTLISGILGLRHSKKWLVVAGQILAFVSLLILSGVESYIPILLIHILLGIGSGTYHSPGTTILVDFSPENRINTYLGIHGFSSSLGMIISPLIVSYFLIFYTLDRLLLFFAFFTLSVALLYSLLIHSDRASKISASDFFSFFRKNARRSFIASYFMRDASFWGLMSFIPLYAFNVVGLSKPASAAIVALFPFMGMFANIAGGVLGDKFGALRVAAACVFFAAFSLFPIILIPSAKIFYMTVVLLGVMLYATIPLFDSIVAYHFPVNLRAPAYGVFQGIGFFVGGIFSLGAGMVSDFIDVRVFFVIIAAILLLSACLIHFEKDIS